MTLKKLVILPLILLSGMVYISADGNNTLPQIIERGDISSDSLGINISFRYDTIENAGMTIVIQTVCAPVCSSIVYMYDADGSRIRTVLPPSHLTFAEAYMEGDSIKWTDNTPVEEFR